MNKRKLLLCFVALGTLVASLALAFNMFGKGIRPTYAASPGVNVTDFYIPTGQEPGGTTFDSIGNVWVAIPGCDPSPTCSSNTPPGKIAEYKPASSSCIATYQLPANYDQPLCLPFSVHGNLWSPRPTAGSICLL